MLRYISTSVEHEDYYFKLLHCGNKKKVAVKSHTSYFNSSSETVIYLKGEET